MSSEGQATLGMVVALWRYPVKSMMGEELNALEITPRGALGDRAYALIDTEDGKIVSAKNPRKWPRMFDFRATFLEPPQTGAPAPAVQITLPDGRTVTSRDENVDQVLSEALGRRVSLQSAAPAEPHLEEYWPKIEGLDHQDTVTDEAILAQTFFDGAPIHLLSTTTLDSLRHACPEAHFEVRRFRPNIVVRVDEPASDFPEDEWLGRTLRLGEQVRVRIDQPCPRCVMTTLAQGDLPSEPDVLRTAARLHRAHVGAYATVVAGGMVKRGDVICLEG